MHPTQNRQRQLRGHLLGRRARAVPLHHVRNLVRHHARKFRFVVRRLNRSQVYVDRPARQRERIDLFLVYHMKIVRPLFSRSM